MINDSFFVPIQKRKSCFGKGNKKRVTGEVFNENIAKNANW
jgi:hypothetical protein